MTYGIHHPALHDGITHEYPGKGPGHFVPEGWEDLEVGICPCGEAVRWNGELEQWEPDRTLTILVLDQGEVASVLDRLRRAGTTKALPTIERQLELNKEFTE